MAAKMVDSITISRNAVFKGASRVVQRVSTTVPAKLEDIMAPTTYVLASGWVDVGGTTEDGLTQTRTAELSDGIPVDQRRVALDKGEPDSWEMSAECTLLDTTYAKLVIALEYGTVTALGTDTGRVAQHQVSIDAPQAFTARQFAFIQEDVKSLKCRAWWFRNVTPAVDSEMVIQKLEATGVPLKLTISTDSAIAEGSGEFGLYFEQD